MEERKEAVSDGWPGLYRTAEPQNGQHAWSHWIGCPLQICQLSSFGHHDPPPSFSPTRHAVTTPSFGHRGSRLPPPALDGALGVHGHRGTTADGVGTLLVIAMPTLRQRPPF